ncbi:5-oxoprolinase subunit PxpB [Brooklawnia cerclae]|uniref:Allophanate hydrolase subunit 1 n=1 Tax=Brooklawnia cerclae TaxID=349934 RepID=A0ABX0SGT3_9ACTN|nr:allophanate hydrolase subunit 1 [Brooklawnia cerclae]
MIEQLPTVQGLRSYTVEPLGESYVLITFTDESEEDRWRHAHSICRSLEHLGYDAVISTYPAYDSVLVEFDALRIDTAGITRILDGLAGRYSEADEAWLRDAVVYRFPIRFGFDIEPIASELGISISELIEMEVSEPIRIRCRAVGGGLMMRNHPTVPPVRRLASPVIRETLGGEFNLAGHQCSIGLSTGRATTGWRTIGRTPVDVAAEFLKPGRNFHIGDLVKLEPISSDAWSQHVGRPIDVIGADS